MDKVMRRELDECIRDIHDISLKINEVSAMLSGCLEGMNAVKFTKNLDRAVEKYQKAESKLKQIK